MILLFLGFLVCTYFNFRGDIFSSSYGYFSVEIFSYKNRDIVGFSNIDENKYIEILSNKTILKIDLTY